MRSEWRKRLAFRNVSALYLGILAFAAFSIWIPETFLTQTTLKSLLTEQAVTALIAVGLVIPLAAGVYDLSVGYTLGVTDIVVAWLMAEQGVPVPVAIGLAVLVGVAIGATNGILVVRLRINSLIATLGIGLGLQALITFVSGGRQIVDLPPSFGQLGANEIFGISMPVIYLAVAAAIVWYLMEQSVTGRYLYATGANQEASRLAGVRTNRLIFGSLIASGLFAGLAGVIVAARIGAGSPDVGPPYLLPAFAAVFLGATQLRNGRFNVLGTILAVYVLAIGVKGLQLVGAPFWLPDLFNSVALLTAVALSTASRDPQRRLA